MPDRFKVTKTDASEIDATYNSILKDEEAAGVLGKLLPPSSNIDSCIRKGKFISNIFASFLNMWHYTCLLKTLRCFWIVVIDVSIRQNMT